MVTVLLIKNKIDRYVGDTKFSTEQILEGLDELAAHIEAIRDSIEESEDVEW